MSVMVTNVNIYLFLVSRNRCFLAALCDRIKRSPNLEAAVKSVLYQQVNISVFDGVNIPKISWCHLTQQMSSHRGSK